MRKKHLLFRKPPFSFSGDTNPDRIHIRKNARYIIERILELGDMKSFKWLHYTLQIIINILTTSRVITEKSRNFWLTWVQN